MNIDFEEIRLFLVRTFLDCPPIYNPQWDQNPSLKRWVGGVRKWQFLMIYSTVNHQRDGWVGLKKSKT